MSSDESDDIPLEQMQHRLNASSTIEDQYEADEDEDEPHISHDSNRINGKLRTDDSLEVDIDDDNFNEDDNSEEDYEPEEAEAPDQISHQANVQHHPQNSHDDEDAVEEDEIELEFEDNDQPQLLYQDENGLEQEESDEDDVPLSVRKVVAAPVKQESTEQFSHRSNGHVKHELKEEDMETSDFDDDVPLASIRDIVAKRAAMKAAASTPQKQVRSKVRKAPASRKTPVTKKPRTSAIKSEKVTKTKKPPKSPVKRATKPKKEEESATRKFDIPGQRRETPPDTDPARLFYQSMYNEKMAKGKRSSIAEQWMLRHGLLDIKVAEKILSRLKTK